MPEYAILPLEGHFQIWLRMYERMNGHDIAVEPQIARIIQNWQTTGADDLITSLQYHCLCTLSELSDPHCYDWWMPFIDYLLEMGTAMARHIQPLMVAGCLPYEVFRISSGSVTLQRIDLFKMEIAREMREEQCRF